METPNKPIKMKALRNDERSLLMRQCLKDGMTKTEAEEYIKTMEKQVKQAHQQERKRVKGTSATDFQKEFSKLLRGKK